MNRDQSLCRARNFEQSREIAICGKFAVVSRRIWQTALRNFEKFAVEKQRSLRMNTNEYEYVHS